jgi:hypothetical protein
MLPKNQVIFCPKIDTSHAYNTWLGGGQFMEPTEGQPNAPIPPKASGPQFGQVFSTTGKVLLALFLISLGISIVYGIVVSIGNSGSSSLTSDYKNTYINGRSYYNDKADNASTKMPLSQWKKLIAHDIKGHCVREGMTPAEVEKAVGKPTTAKTVSYGDGAAQSADKGDVWEYTTQEVVKNPCSRYEGEKCIDPVEYKIKTGTLYFSPKGNLTYPYLNGPLREDIADGDRSYCD